MKIVKNIKNSTKSITFNGYKKKHKICNNLFKKLYLFIVLYFINVNISILLYFDLYIKQLIKILISSMLRYL